MAAHVAEPLHPREFRCRIRLPDGTERCLFARLSAVEHEGEITRYLVLTDLTGWQRAEDALRTQAGFVGHVIHEFPHPVYALDAAGVFVECNHAFAAMVGRDRSEVIGSAVGDVVPPGDREAFVAADAEVLARPGERVYCTTLSVAGKGPSRVLVRKVSLRSGADGAPTLVGVILDRPGLCLAG
jgi:PAS domain S-box-containing protein